jgi:hypothetical protein
MYYVPSIYAYFFQFISLLYFSPPTPCMNLSFASKLPDRLWGPPSYGYGVQAAVESS